MIFLPWAVLAVDLMGIAFIAAGAVTAAISTRWTSAGGTLFSIGVVLILATSIYLMD